MVLHTHWAEGSGRGGQVDDEGTIVDSCFKTFGCGSAIASSSVATEWVKGKSIDKAVTITNTEIAKHLSLPPVKLHCSMLAEDAIKVRAASIPLHHNSRHPLSVSILERFSCTACTISCPTVTLPVLLLDLPVRFQASC